MIKQKKTEKKREDRDCHGGAYVINKVNMNTNRNESIENQ